MATSLEDALKGIQPAEQDTPEEPQAEEPAEPTAEGVEADETAEETPQEEPAAPPAATKEVPLAALLDERDKRKAADEKVREYEERLKQEKPDFWENPEQAVSEIETRLRSEFDEKFTRGLLSYSMQSASYRHDDYDEALESFKAAAEQNPALADQAVTQPDPGEWIYRTGKQFSQLDAAGGDIDSLREQIRNEERAKLMKELKDKADNAPQVPEAITDETNAAAPREKVEGGPTPLENIFSNQR